MQTRELVEKYIHFFSNPQRRAEELSPILDSAISFRGPLGNFSSADGFLSDIVQDKLLIHSIKIHQILIDGDNACALYDVISRDPEIGTLSFSEWFQVKNNRIHSIVSIYDATGVKETYSRI